MEKNTMRISFFYSIKQKKTFLSHTSQLKLLVESLLVNKSLDEAVVV
jgi:hypothetical protein